MRQAGAEYLQEEARYRGARPRVKVELYPFEVDYGLAPGAGVFVHTAYGGEPGKLVMEEGYYTSGSWVSPVMQTFSPYLTGLTPTWDDDAGIMEARVYLRGGATQEEVANAPFEPVARGGDYSLAAYFQVQVELQESIRGWAVDDPGEADVFTAYAVNQAPEAGYESYAAAGENWGYLSGLRFQGRLTVPESEIIDPGVVRVNLARDFSELRAADHVLMLDHRRGQWLNVPGNPYFQGLEVTQKQVALYHGWERPGDAVEWQLLYRGVVQRLTGMDHGWRTPHRVRLESQDEIAARLQQRLGGPTPAGEKRPFLRGTYLARAELRQTTPAAVREPVKTGSGWATLTLLGTYRGEYPQDYLLEVVTGGDVGSATFRWSINQGQSWKESGLETAAADDPVELEEGLAVYWESGPGTDLVSGDRWAFAAAPTVYHYQVDGAPFAAVAAVYLNDEETADRVGADATTGLIQVTGRSGSVEARVVKDGTTHPVDIITDILEEVGLGQAMHQDSFDLAKSLTPAYAIGVRFENITAAQALREILRRCLYDLWVDFGEIKIGAYLGED